MKRQLVATIAAVSLLPGIAGAVDTETFGTVCIPISGHTGAGSTTLSFIGLGVVGQLADTGSVTSAGANTLTDTTGDWAGADFTTAPHYVVITSGAHAGVVSDITGITGATVLDTLDDLSALVPTVVGESYEIRLHSTVASIFGPANEGGLQADLNSADADNVQLVSPNGGVQTLFFSTDSGTPGWRDGNLNPAGGTVINPEQGVVVARKQAMGLSLYLNGALRVGSSVVPVEEGFNLLGLVRSEDGLTLDGTGLFTGDPVTGVTGGSNPSIADNVLTVETDGSVTRHFYRTTGTTGWHDTTFVASGTRMLDAGTAFYIVRKAGNGGAFNWTIPAE